MGDRSATRLPSYDCGRRADYNICARFSKMVFLFERNLVRFIGLHNTVHTAIELDLVILTISCQIDVGCAISWQSQQQALFCSYYGIPNFRWFFGRHFFILCLILIKFEPQCDPHRPHKNTKLQHPTPSSSAIKCDSRLALYPIFDTMSNNYQYKEFRTILKLTL